MMNSYLSFAQELADAAGEIARRYFGGELLIEVKADQSPVSIADKEIERTLRHMIGARFPEHGILGEEFLNDDMGAEYVWVIDPIDGTRAFISGQSTFTTLIALCENGVPILGVIDQPIRRERYMGARGHASSLNGQPIHVRACAALSEAVLATTGLEYFSAEHRPAFDAVAKACKETRLGGDAYNYAQLAAGKIDLVVESGLKAYDAMALGPVIEGAGGVIKTWDGKAISLSDYSHVCVAGDARAQAETLRLLSGQD